MFAKHLSMSSSCIPLTLSDIVGKLQLFGISGHKVVVHTSLSSLGRVEGGAETVIRALQALYPTIMMPAFCWAANAPPPAYDRPMNNGCHYSFYDNWNKPANRFIVESAGIEKNMGVVSRCFLKFSGVSRSDHPWHSWAAWGENAERYTAQHPWNTTNLPLEKLADDGGWVMLLGVNLNACTAIHVAEEMAGRRPFIRWMRDREGAVRRVRVSGCGKGFYQLLPCCESLFRTLSVGYAQVCVAPLSQLIVATAKAIVDNPEITICSPECIRCADAIAGGPPDNNNVTDVKKGL